MERYFVGHKVSGEAADYYYQVTGELAQKFGIKDLGERVAPHLTLKPPFESARIAEFERMLSGIASSHKPIAYVVEGFDVFEKEGKDSTIFLAVAENSGLQSAAQDIAKSIADFGDDREMMHVLPAKIRLHISIARYLSQAELSEIMEYLRSRPTPRFDATFDNLTLFKYRPGGWDTIKVFQIGA